VVVVAEVVVGAAAANKPGIIRVYNLG